MNLAMFTSQLTEQHQHAVFINLRQGDETCWKGVDGWGSALSLHFGRILFPFPSGDPSVRPSVRKSDSGGGQNGRRRRDEGREEHFLLPETGEQARMTHEGSKVPHKK